jgi:FKBP-type peptidyl-prolyl cis-trans isomerase
LLLPEAAVSGEVGAAEVELVEVEEQQQQQQEEGWVIRAKPALVQYKDIQVGKGDTIATLGRRILVDYEGYLASTGACFDRSRGAPLRFVIGHEDVVEGFEDGVLGMRLGGQRMIVVPPEMGYGNKDLSQRGIPPHSTLKFKITLVGFEAT